MQSKKIIDALMIFGIGSTPLAFQYLKQHVQITTIPLQIYNDLPEDIRNHFNLSFQTPQPLIKFLTDCTNQSSPQVQKPFIARIQKLLSWHSTSLQSIYKQTLAISFLHAAGAFIYPSAFFLSICSYFLLYQINFMNDFMILKGKEKIIQESKFSLEKVNKLYLAMSVGSVACAALSKGFKKLNQKAIMKFNITDGIENINKKK